jgi:NADP-dependent 3-hydroxy acid dehydrogenase YdfG
VKVGVSEATKRTSLGFTTNNYEGTFVPVQIDLTGQTAVVTGASSGIGRAIAERLGASGAHVVLSGRTELAMKESADKIVAAGGRATIDVGDVRDPDVVRRLVDNVVASDGHLDIFVNNAGYSVLGSVLDGDVDSWRAMLETNVLALLVGCQAAVKAMRATGRPGHIINTSSIAALSPNSGVYGATKHAVNVITNTLRAELDNDPIQISSVMPGLVATNLGRENPEIVAGIVAMSGVEHEVKKGERLPDEILEGSQALLGDFIIRPDDIADAVLYLLSVPSSVDVTEIVIRPNKHFDL